MPLYEYVCQDCGHHFDVLRSMKEADQPVRCKNCLGDRTKRALSVFYAQASGRSNSGAGNSGGGGCGGCSGGSCGSCGHH